MIRILPVLLVLAALVSTLPGAALACEPAFQPTRFSVTVAGEGPDVILIPGLMTGRQVWDQSVRSLGGRYRVHLVQIAGFAGEPARGNVEGPILDGMVEELHLYIAADRLQRPKLVGHSLGGLLALMLAARHPGDAERVLIVDALPFYGMLFGVDATAATVAPRAAAIRDSILGMSEEAWRAQQPATLASLIRTEAARPPILADALASDRSVVARAMYDDMITDMRPALADLPTPLTIAYAVNEFATEEQYGSLIRSGFAGAPDVRFVPVTASFHFIMLDQRELFAGILSDFLSARGE
jgi:pimeloyl-ACP methyl ester carboxylesterase